MPSEVDQQSSTSRRPQGGMIILSCHTSTPLNVITFNEFSF